MKSNPCVPINGLALDQDSINQLIRMKHLDKSGKFVNALLAGNAFIGIMGGKSPTTMPSTNLDKIWTISQTDWNGYAQAMGTVPKVFRMQIEKEAELLAYEYAMKNNSRQLRLFWEGVANGCKY